MCKICKKYEYTNYDLIGLTYSLETEGLIGKAALEESTIRDDMIWLRFTYNTTFHSATLVCKSCIIKQADKVIIKQHDSYHKGYVLTIIEDEVNNV